MVVFLKGEGDTVLATVSFMLNEEFACDWQKALEESLQMFSAAVSAVERSVSYTHLTLPTILRV